MAWVDQAVRTVAMPDEAPAGLPRGPLFRGPSSRKTTGEKEHVYISLCEDIDLGVHPPVECGVRSKTLPTL